MKGIVLITVLAILVFCFPINAQENKAVEFTVSRGKPVNGFTFSRKGALLYNRKQFSPRVVIKSISISEFEISALEKKKWACAVGVMDGFDNKVFFLDLEKMSATPMQKPDEGHPSDKIYWSPSLKYLIGYGYYEGESFFRFDTQTKKVRELKRLEPFKSFDRMWRVVDDPHWSGNNDVLLFNVTEHCNYFEIQDCDFEKILARYEVSLDATTFRISYKKLMPK